MKKYEDCWCKGNKSDCENCSLVNYGRDCHNNPVNAEQKKVEKYSTEEIEKLKEGLVEVWRDWARASWATKYVYKNSSGEITSIIVSDSEGNELRSWEADEEGWDAEDAEGEADKFVDDEIEGACQDYSELWGDSEEARLYGELSEISNSNQDGEELLDYEQEIIQAARYDIKNNG